MNQAPQTARLFFALWPDPEIQTAFSQAGQLLYGTCKGKPTKVENIHLTMAFLGDTPVERIGELNAIAASVSCPPFEMNFSQLGWWRHNQVAWATCQEIPNSLKEFQRQLNEGLRKAGFPAENRPFVPHVTLLRKARCKGIPPLETAIRWPVKEFVLVQSQLDSKGSIYEKIGNWVFANP